MNKLFIVFVMFSCITFAQKTYKKDYYENGNIKSEGWVLNSEKTAYWKFYYSNGVLEREGRFLKNQETKYWIFYNNQSRRIREGHYKDGKKCKWWLFYNDIGQLNQKCQMEANKKEGYCFDYQSEKLVSASKYKSGVKIKEWTDYASFFGDNDVSRIN